MSAGEHLPCLQERLKSAEHAIDGRYGAEEVGEHLGFSRLAERGQQQRDEDHGLGSRRFASKADRFCRGHKAVAAGPSRAVLPCCPAQVLLALAGDRWQQVRVH